MPAKKISTAAQIEVRSDRKNQGNGLDGKTWLQNSISIWSDIVKSQDDREHGHPAMFPEALAKRIIQTFTSPEAKEIIDPFVGTGSTLVAANELGKNGWGFDISKEYIKIAKKRIKNSPVGIGTRKPDQRLVCDSSVNISKYVKNETVDLCFTSPPYWDILSQSRSADLKDVRDYVEDKNNIGNQMPYENFLGELEKIFTQVFKVLKSNGYCIVNVMDLRKKSSFFPLHMDLTNIMRDVGFVLDDIIIWDRRKDYNNLKPLGYPYVFRVNKVHEFIMIFQKR